MANLDVAQEDRHLRRSLGLWQLTAIGFSGVIGSGWLLGAMVAAQLAGPEAIVAWLVGGAVLMLIALVMANLGGIRPESGGLIRWPYYSSGRLVATLAGWGIWIAYATNPPSESAAMLQYASRYVPGIYRGSALTGLGVLLGIGVMAVFVLVNWFGVQLFARINGALTVAKFVVPTLTVIALFVSGFHGGNFSSHGGFAPYGWAPGLSAIATAGIIYAYTGFQGPIDLSGEARNPRRDVPRAVIMSLAGSLVLYLLLQVVFVAAVPGHDLIHGWSGVSFSSPFAQLAVSANLTWLSWVLYADAIASPAGSALAFTAAAGRESYAMSKNRFLPRAAGKVDRRSGVPRRALVINFVIGLAFLLPLHSWQSIVAATSELALIAYALPAVSLIAFRRAERVTAGRTAAPETPEGPAARGDTAGRTAARGDTAGRTAASGGAPEASAASGGAPEASAASGTGGGMAVLAPAAFVLASMILYWATWKELRIALPVLLVGAVVYGVQQYRGGVDWFDVRVGAWLVGYLVAILVMSAIGSRDFGGANWIPAPWDSVVVAVIGAIGYELGVRNAVKHLAVHPAPEPAGPDPDADDAADDFGAAPVG
jgi:amino acid transporter